MNLVILKGNLGKDPEIKTFDNGNKKASFSLATKDSYTDKKGEKVSETEWHNIVFWGKIVDTIKQYVHKGDELLVTGKTKSRTYEDKNGVTKYITEVICDRFEFSGSKKDNGSSGGSKKEPAQPSNTDELPGADLEDDFLNGSDENRMDDDLPY